MALEATVWEYALADIPTEHLEECFKRALAGKRDDYLMKATALTVEWDTYHEELRATARANAARVENERLLLGSGSAWERPVTLHEWKGLHNLPEEWNLGDPYPPQSDLYGLPSAQASGEWVMDPVGTLVDSRWHMRRRKPWELYPNQHNPQRKVVAGVEWLWYIEVCPEADNPNAHCPGFITEHTGPAGTWEKQMPCPDHSFRLRELTTRREKNR